MRVEGGELATGTGYGVPVRVEPESAEGEVEPFDELVGHRMFEDFGFLVYFVPAVAELGDEEHLDQPMAAHHLQRTGQPGFGEGDAAVGAVVDQALPDQPAQHPGHRRR